MFLIEKKRNREGKVSLDSLIQFYETSIGKNGYNQT